MNNKNNLKINQTQNEKKNKYNLKMFCKILYAQIRYNKWKSIIFTITTILLLYCILNYKNFNCEIEFINNNVVVLTIIKIFGHDISSNIVIPIIATIIYVIITILLGIPIGAKEIEENCTKAGIVNHLQQSPIFISKYINKFNKKVIIYEFFANATSYKEQWLKFQERLEDSFDNYYIKGIRKKGKRILVYLTKEDPKDPKTLYWNNKYLIEYKGGSPVVNIGRNKFDEPYLWETKKLPHEKLGGSTGAGKTATQKLICYELLMQNSDLYVYDGKEIDYTGSWKKINNCIVVNNFKSFQNMVKMIYEIHISRQKELKFPCYNIDTFNKLKSPIKPRKHIFLVIEEAADIFDIDVKQLSKEEKEKYQNCIEILKELARKGRTTGCHLCINSQRLSADIIPPQINSCLKFKLCGFADDILSKIMVENTDAHDLLNDNVAGVIVDGNHNVIQCYYIDPDTEQELLKPFEIDRDTMSKHLKKYDIGEDELEIDWDKFVNDYVEDKEAYDPDHFKIR